MNQQSHATGGSRLLTIEAILAEHERLLAAQAEREDVDQIRSFVAKLEGSGVYFDEAFERKALQGTLDYWTSELAKHLADQDSSGQKRRSIRNFDAEALRALQGDFTNPFGGIADRMVSLDPGDRHSPAAILRLIDETAQPQNLRFQDGLLKEMISQVAGDSERGSAMQAARERDDASLLEFCLWHLFEDPETRLGNKLYRPRKSGHKLERVDFFSCKVYLVRKADQLFEAAGRPASMLDALMRMGGGTMRPQRPASFLASIAGKFEGFGRAALASLRSRRLQAPKFELYGEKALDLPQFLQAARLAFNEGGKWRIVHPALARWDPLKERRWKAAQKEKLLFLSFTAVVVALVTSLAWIGWYELWTSLAMSRLAKAQIATDPKERVAESVAGLRAAKLSMASDNSYASQVGNDAIGAVIGERARSGKGAMSDLQPYPNLPRLECEQIQGLGTGLSYSVTVANASAKLSADACPVFAVNLDGTRLAAAWEKAGRVRLRVFEIPADFRLGSDDNAALRDADLKAEAPWMQNAKLRELELEPPLNREPASLAHECKDRALRFSEDDRTASFECLYSVDQRTSTVQWIPASITDADSGAAARAAIAGAKNVVADTGNTLKSCASRDGPPRTSRVTSVFLGPRTGSGSGFVTVQGDGYVQIWHDGQPPCLSTQFRSDFVRVATGGRPATLDVQDVAVPRPMYAIYALSPTPVVRVYEQDARHARLLMEHYPPAGVGTPVGIRFTQNARCLQIRANRTSGGGLAAVDYYLILDLDRLLAIGRALEEDLGSATTVTDVPLARYSRAIEKECYGR